MRNALVLATIVALGSVACGGSDDEEETPTLTAAEHEAKILSGMHSAVLTEIQSLRQASGDICAAAPSPVGQGWDASADAAALEATKGAWILARSAYERTEGVIAPLFPDTDYAIDARYDDYLL